MGEEDRPPPTPSTGLPNVPEGGDFEPSTSLNYPSLDRESTLDVVSLVNDSDQSPVRLIVTSTDVPPPLRSRPVRRVGDFCHPSSLDQWNR